MTRTTGRVARAHGKFRAWLREWLGVAALAALPIPTAPTKPWRVPTALLARLRGKAARVNIFAVPASLHPEAVTEDAMAMDAAVGDYSAWAGSTYAGFEGEQFIGFPMLAEMATRPEYRRASEIIARHMTRKWIKFQATGEEDKGDKIAAIEAEMVRLNVKAMFQRAAEQDGYFGRAHLFLDFGDWDQPEELLTPIGTGRDKVSAGKCQPGRPLKRLATIEAQWCYPQDYNATNPFSPDWYRPQAWTTPHGKVHGTRLLTFIGREVPDMLKPSYSFGGLSLSQMGRAAVDNWLETRKSVNDAISAYSVMVFKTNMKEAVQGAGDAMFDRAELMNEFRDNRGMIVVDKESEDFDNIAAPLGTLDALQGQAQEHPCATWGIPVEIYTGIQPAGLNASSEGQVRIFQDTIHSAQEHLFRPNLDTVIGFIQLSLFGEIDDEITYEFADLAALDDKEKAELELVKAQVDEINVNIGAIGAGDVRLRLSNDPDSLYDGLDPDDLPPAPGENDPEGAPPAPGEEPDGRAMQ